MFYNKADVNVNVYKTNFSPHKEEQSMRSVVLQPLCEVFSPPVLQLALNPATGKIYQFCFIFPSRIKRLI